MSAMSKPRRAPQPAQDKPLLSYEQFKDANELQRSKSAGEEYARAVLATAREALSRKPPMRNGGWK